MGFNSVIFFRKIPNSVKSRFFFWVFLLKFWPFRMVRTRYILLKTNPTRLKTSLTSIQGLRSSVCQRPDRSGDFLGPKKVRAIFCRHITNYISKRVQVIFMCVFKGILYYLVSESRFYFYYFSIFIKNWP